MNSTRYTADVTNPTTGETTTLEADSEADLEQLVDEHLGAQLGELP